MKSFRRFLGHQICPRCKEKQLKMTLWGHLKKDGEILRATLTIQRDTNPACMWGPEEYSLTSDQAKRLIAAVEIKEAREARKGELNQPSLGI
jgi:NMD protein affecting ribosome stability and mRNA decay